MLVICIHISTNAFGFSCISRNTNSYAREHAPTKQYNQNEQDKTSHTTQTRQKTRTTITTIDRPLQTITRGRARNVERIPSFRRGCASFFIWFVIGAFRGARSPKMHDDSQQDASLGCVENHHRPEGCFCVPLVCVPCISHNYCPYLTDFARNVFASQAHN